jgi:hypothetical protein
LKIPKGYPESVKRRRTENTMAERKRTKQQSTKHTHKIKDRVIPTPQKNRGEVTGAPEG